jgi:hypothetical protein
MPPGFNTTGASTTRTRAVTSAPQCYVSRRPWTTPAPRLYRPSPPCRSRTSRRSFSYLQRNAVTADRHSHILPRQVIEIGIQLDL